MSEQLYKKVMVGKRTTYQPVVPEPVKVLEFTDAQCVTLLATFERNVPAHKRIARKVKAVNDSIIDLFQGCGVAIDPDMADLACSTWDKTMRELSA